MGHWVWRYGMPVEIVEQDGSHTCEHYNRIITHLSHYLNDYSNNNSQIQKKTRIP